MTPSNWSLQLSRSMCGRSLTFRQASLFFRGAVPQVAAGIALGRNHPGHSPDKSLVGLTEGHSPSAHQMAEP